MNDSGCLGINTKCDEVTRPTPFDVLVGLNYDLYPTRNGSGQIYFNQLAADSFYFKTTQTYISLLNGHFIPTNAFMITYDEVYHWDRSKNSIASFQIFLSTDSTKSYVLFHYISCPIDLDSYGQYRVD